MSQIKTWHLWKCDGCGTEKKLEHGEWAEPRFPAGWWQVIGWNIHACTEDCRHKAESAFRRNAPNPGVLLWHAPESPNHAWSFASRVFKRTEP